MMRQALARWSNFLNGGNQWSGWVSYLSFFRHEAGLDIDYSKWQHYEAACIHGGPRFMHADFCVVADRPLMLHRDDANRPHRLDGPFCEWRDGVRLYRVRGVEVPAEWITDRANLAPEMALTWPNIEQRRAAAELIGWDRVLTKLHVRTIQVDENPETGTLLEASIDGAPARFLKVQCGTKRTFVLPVPREMSTALEANAWTFGLRPEELKIEVRT